MTKSLYLRDSMFGWVVIGSINSSGTPSNTLLVFHVESSPSHLEKFWQLEEVPQHHTKTRRNSL